jgi:hypothetical protein
MELNEMTVSELRKLAAQQNIQGRSTMKKAELVKALSDEDIADVVELAVTVDKLNQANQVEQEEAAEADSEEQEEPVATEIMFYNITRDGASALILFDNGDKRFAHVERFGHMLTIRERGFLTQSFKVKAVSFDRLARKWAKGLGVWNTEIKVTKEF